MIPDWHGLEESVDIQLDAIPRYTKDADGVRILHEPLCRRPMAVQSPRTFDIWQYKSAEEFWKDQRLEENWGESRSYLKLYDTLYDSMEHGLPTYQLGPLDCSLHDRQHIARALQNLAISYRAGLESRPELLREFERLKKIGFSEREQFFAKAVDEAREDGIGTAVVITHPAHIARRAGYLGDYDVEIVEVDKDDAEEYSAREDKIQLRFAQDIDILGVEIPPIVPIFSLVYRDLQS